MENASTTISPMNGGASLRHRTMPSKETAPLVVITSVLTETIRPTLIVTESTVIPPPVPVTTQMNAQLATTSVDSRLQTSHLEATHPESGLQQTTQQNTVFSTSTFTKTSASPTEELTTSRGAELGPGFLGHLNASSPSDLVPTHTVSSNSSSSWSSSTIAFSVHLATLPGITSNIPSSDTSPTITPLTSIPVSPSHSPVSLPSTSPAQNTTTGSGTVQGSSTPHRHKPFNVGPIVGGTIGGTAFIALSVLTCFLLSRRTRQAAFHRRQNSRRSLLPRTTNPSRTSHNRQISEPTLPTGGSPAIPSAPVFPIRSYSTPDGVRPALLSTPFSTDGFADRTELQGNHGTENPFADPENNFLTSPSLEVFPPSRSEPMYSESSWGSGSKLLERHERSLRNFRNEGSYYADGSTLTLPRSSVGPDSFMTSRNRSSTRSDPFDLEPPPDEMPKWPL